ncbi:AI-2E family transporter [Candidatus Gottesmanbacteria bacterium]|nr:AI-2E family transporter [Candidatus Gottesmanbacteria bacterium]
MAKIEFSYRTVLFTLGLLAGVWVFIQIRDILFLLFIAFLLMTAIHPLVVMLERIRIPRVLSILIVYVVVFGLFGVSLAGTIPLLVTQSTKLITDLPTFAARVLPYWNIDVGMLTKQIAPISENIVGVTVGIFSNVITTLTTLVFTFYFLLERPRAEQVLTPLVGEQMTKKTIAILRAIEKRLGKWVRGELMLMFSIGIFSYIGLMVLHVDFALPLAIIAGVLEIVPTIGPIVSAIPAILVALAISPFLALTVAALYFIIQQTENNLLVPLVMKRTIGFSPLVTILSVMIGGRFAGAIGAVLAVPLLLVLQILVAELFIQKSGATSRSA